ncbi:cytochrome b/b6 domain-containing protein [Roseospira marina]|nr:cytochrome b/b6 domain-containing protein [Roseospira marina]MBB4314743.1 cytochrome b [Roseospira marina]MBB5087732.1 cytochrome b [Roseospira marina]
MVRSQDTTAEGPANAAPSAPRSVIIWDIPTRAFHWALAIALGVAWWSGEEGQFTVHFIAGHVVIGLIVFRLIWGVIGSETARFAQFVRGPGAVVRYLAQMFRPAPDKALGHNPAGAIMVILLLLAVTVQAVSGLFASENTYAFVSGPLRSFVSADLSETITGLHKGVIFNTLLTLAGVHILAAFFYLIVKRENLIRPMVLGRKTLPAHSTAQAPRLARPWLGWLVALVAAGAAWGLYRLM